MGWKALRAACCLLSISCATTHFFRQKLICDKRRGEASGRRKTDCGNINIIFAAGSSGNSRYSAVESFCSS